MNKLLYRNKSSLLKVKHFFNSVFGIDIIKYPSPELARRFALIKHHNIDVVLDVGANIGQFGNELRTLGYKGRIISFEPVKAAFEKLKNTSSKDPNWDIFNISLGERDDTVKINVSENSVSSSILENLSQLTDNAPQARYVRTETIRMRRLDDIRDELNLEEKNIYLKIDTQGYEDKVLKGASAAIEMIKGIQVEMSLLPSYKGVVGFEEMKSRLNGYGFVLMAIENGFYDKRSGRQLEIDGIFYRE